MNFYINTANKGQLLKIIKGCGASRKHELKGFTSMNKEQLRNVIMENFDLRIYPDGRKAFVYKPKRVDEQLYYIDENGDNMLSNGERKSEQFKSNAKKLAEVEDDKQDSSSVSDAEGGNLTRVKPSKKKQTKPKRARKSTKKINMVKNEGPVVVEYSDNE